MSTMNFGENLNYESYQALCDEVFGEGVVKCGRVLGINNIVTMQMILEY